MRIDAERGNAGVAVLVDECGPRGYHGREYSKTKLRDNVSRKEHIEITINVA